jgi:hypothetical protein
VQDRATVIQKKTGRPVQFEITEQERSSDASREQGCGRMTGPTRLSLSEGAGFPRRLLAIGVSGSEGLSFSTGFVKWRQVPQRSPAVTNCPPTGRENPAEPMVHSERPET